MGGCLEVAKVVVVIARNKKGSGARIFSAVFFLKAHFFQGDLELGWS